MAGIELDTKEIPIELRYCVANTSDFNRIEEKSAIYHVPSLYAKVKDNVASIVFELAGKTLTDYNCIFVNPYFEKIVYQASGFEYEFNETEQKGYLTIKYVEYTYSDFAVLLKDNDPDDGVEATIHLYTTDAKETQTDEGTLITLTFSYHDLARQFGGYYASSEFIIEDEDVIYTNYNEDKDTLEVIETGDAVQVKFLLANQDDLRNLSIVINAEVMEDIEMKVQIKYAELISQNGGIVVQEGKMSERYTIMYSEYMKINMFGLFQESEYYKLVTDALVVEELGDMKYYVPYDISCTDEETGGDYIVTIEVLYTKYNLFRINTIGDDKPSHY